MSIRSDSGNRGTDGAQSPESKAQGPLRRADLAVAAVLCVCGASALISTSRMRIGPSGAFQPRLFPSLVGWFLILASALLIFDTLRTPELRSIEWPSRAGRFRITVMLCSLAAQILLIDVVGMPLATFLAVTFQVWFLGEYRWRVPVLTGLAAAAAVYGVFIYGLGLTFPTGLFQN